MQNEKWKEINGKWQLVELDREESDMQAAHPWRRFLARGLDVNLYVLLWGIVAYLGLHWNIQGWVWREILIGYAIMILLEPFMLRLFGTTPGKALFGIRVKNPDGGKLTIGKGFWRVWRMFGRGYGYSIPIYNLVRLYKSRKRCLEYGKIEWDEDDYENRVSVVTVNKKLLPLRAAVYILAIAAMIAVQVILPFVADMPKHRGEITVEQLHANIYHYWQYHNLTRSNEVIGGGMIMSDGGFEPLPVRQNRRDLIGWTPPEVTIHEANGIVTGVSYEVSGETLWWGSPIYEMGEWARCLAVAFIGAQDGMNFYRMHFSGGVLYDMQALFGFPLHGDTAGWFYRHGVRVEWYATVDWDASVFNAYFHMWKV